MGRLAVPQIKTACGMGRCPRVFRTVEKAMQHLGTHRLPGPPDGREKPIWQVRYRMARSGWLEIVEVLSGPAPNLPVHEGQFSPAGRIPADLAKATV